MVLPYCVMLFIGEARRHKQMREIMGANGSQWEPMGANGSQWETIQTTRTSWREGSPIRKHKSRDRHLYLDNPWLLQVPVIKQYLIKY